ncbi:MAG: prefoldin subunit beta [Candidatus Aenigmarchaeota archaeon]|nr:prefoldin subunit beta [Candidatus Aenigmarchaeota archaeon]
MQADEILNTAQTYQQQIQVVMTQKAALTLELNEIKKAIEELERTKQGDVFKISGPILIRVDAKDLKKELDDKKELINLRIKTLEKQENKLKEKIEELRNKLLNVRKNSR